jgi:hypothetical protein
MNIQENLEQTKAFKECIVEDSRTEKLEIPVFEIPIHNLAYLKQKIEKLNKVTKKLNLKSISLEISNPFAKKIKNKGGDKKSIFIEFVKVKINGEAPKLKGWSFIGKRSPLDGTKSILTKSAPGMTIPKRFHNDAGLKCDHCNRASRRSETFIVKKGRTHREVGRSCLKDFLGHQDPNKYASYAESLYVLLENVGKLGDVDSEYYGGGRSHAVQVFDIVEIVAAAVHRIKQHGFVSNQYASDYKTSTSMLVADHIDPPLQPSGSRISAQEWHAMHHIPATPQDKKEAVDAIEWMKNHPKAKSEEFWNNISKIVSAGAHSSRKNIGYITAGVQMYLKEKGESKQREGVMSSLSDSYVGDVGEKIDVTGTVINVFSYMSGGQWGGMKRVITIKTDSGQLIKMFTASGDSGVTKDAKVWIVGKIGSNGVENYDRSPFKGEKMTTMAPRSRIGTL